MLSRVDIFQQSHEFKTVDICFKSLLHKFDDVMHYNYSEFKMTFATKNLTFFQHDMLWFKALTYHDQMASPGLCAHALCANV